MMRLVLFIIGLVCLTCTFSCSSDTTVALGKYVDYQWTELSSSFPDSLGRSAVVAGILDGNLIVGAGANFPDGYPKDGGTKHFYDDLFRYENGSWTQLPFKLPENKAYGVSFTTDKGILSIGGTSDGRISSADVLLISADSVCRLHSMPYSLFDASASMLDNKIYLAGGTHNGTPSSRVFVFDINSNEWSEIESPFQPRVQPVTCCQNFSEEKCFVVFGGYNPLSKEIYKDGYAYFPSRNKWKKLMDAPCALNGGSAFSCGTHSVMFFGGVNEEIFHIGITTDNILEYQSHEKSWYRFNGKLLCYNTIVDTWTEASDMPEALAGSVVVPMAEPSNNGLWVVMGETQPGVRTSKIWCGNLIKRADFGIANWIVLFLYLFGMLIMGFYFMSRQKTSDHYFTGDGKIPWWAVSVSIFATMLSAITFMAIPAKTYATDWRYFIMAVAIFFVALPVIKYFLPFFRRLNVTTAYQYLEFRFNSTVRIMASLLFMLFMVARMALVIYLPSLALTAVTGIDIFLCIILISVITIIYSSIGGIEAVIWGDVVQGIILMGGALFTLIYLIVCTDGNALEIAIEHDKFSILNMSLDFTQGTFWVVLIGGSVNSFISYSSDQTIIQRYMTTSDEKKAAKSIFTNGILSVFSSFVFYSIGTALFAYYLSRPETLDFSLPTGDSIFPYYIMSGLPDGVAGVLIAAIFAASMSTVSSNINSISTAWIVDIRSKFKFVSQDDLSKLRAARFISVFVGFVGCVFALVMAIWNVLSLFDWFNMILGLLTGGLCALFVMGVFIERINAKAALVGFISGSVSIFFISIYTDLFFMMYGFVNIVVSIFVALLLSYVFKPESKSMDGLVWKRKPN